MTGWAEAMPSEVKFRRTLEQACLLNIGRLPAFNRWNLTSDSGYNAHVAPPVARGWQVFHDRMPGAVSKIRICRSSGLG